MNAANRHLRQTAQIHSSLGTAAGDVLQVEIAELRSALVYCGRFSSRLLSAFLQRRFAAIKHAETDRVTRNVQHADIRDVYLLNHTAAPASALKAQTNVRAHKY